MGHKGHGTGGPEGVHLGEGAFDLHILRLSRVDVGDHRVKGYAGALKGLVVEGVQLVGNLVVGVLRVHNVALPQQRAQAHVVFVRVEALVVADHPSLLPGQVVHPEQRPGGNAHHAVHVDPIVQKYVQNASGVHAPHGAAFQYQSRFHCILLAVAQWLRLSYPPDASDGKLFSMLPHPRGKVKTKAAGQKLFDRQRIRCYTEEN